MSSKVETLKSKLLAAQQEEEQLAHDDRMEELRDWLEGLAPEASKHLCESIQRYKEWADAPDRCEPDCERSRCASCDRRHKWFCKRFM